MNTPEKHPDQEMIDRIHAVATYFLNFEASMRVDEEILHAVIVLDSIGVSTGCSCSGWNPGHRGWPNLPRKYFSTFVIELVDQNPRFIGMMEPKEGIDFVKKELEEFYSGRKTDVRHRLRCTNSSGLKGGDIPEGECSYCDYVIVMQELDAFVAFLQDRHFPEGFRLEDNLPAMYPRNPFDEKKEYRGEVYKVYQEVGKWPARPKFYDHLMTEFIDWSKR